MRNFRSGAFGLAREELADGKVSKEIEHMFYARVDMAALTKAASVETQEQWGLWHDKTADNAASGSVRIRHTVPKGILPDGSLAAVRSKEQFVMTTKIKTASGDALEIPIETTADNFKAFKLLAESGMIKHRYIFPIEGTELKWEVDMFIELGEDITSTKYLPWAKIDLEVPNKEMAIPAFPDGFSEAFNSKDGNLSDEQREVVTQMKPYLSLPNPHVTKMYEGVV